MKPFNSPQTNRRLSAGVLATALAAALTAACGGGGEILAILQIVTPLGGAWNEDVVGGGNVSFTDAETRDKQYQSKLSVEVSIAPQTPAVCGPDIPLQGTLDNGKLALFPNTAPASTTPCITGVFTDLRRLELSVSGEAAKRVYTNDRVAVKLQEGVWSPDSGSPVLKFLGPDSVDNAPAGNTQSVTGCDVTDTNAKVRFNGTMTGFNVNTLARPSAPKLDAVATGATLFTQLEFVDGATIRLVTATGQNLTLTRKPDPVQPDPRGTPCP